MSAIAGKTAGPNFLIFFYELHGPISIGYTRDNID